MRQLGNNISILRKNMKMKSKELAALVGVKQPYISAIENGKKKPSLDVLQKISAALQTSTSELLGEKPQELSSDIKRLIIYASDLNPSQVDALISVAKELTREYKK